MKEMTASFAMPDLSRALLKPPRVIYAWLDSIPLKTELLVVRDVSLEHSREIFEVLQARSWPIPCRFYKFIENKTYKNSDAICLVATFFGIKLVVTIVRE